MDGEMNMGCQAMQWTNIITALRLSQFTFGEVDVVDISSETDCNSVNRSAEVFGQLVARRGCRARIITPAPDELTNKADEELDC